MRKALFLALAVASFPFAEARPKVRAITAFTRIDAAHYETQIAEAVQFLSAARDEYKAAGFEVERILRALQRQRRDQADAAGNRFLRHPLVASLGQRRQHDQRQQRKITLQPREKLPHALPDRLHLACGNVAVAGDADNQRYRGHLRLPMVSCFLSPDRSSSRRAWNSKSNSERPCCHGR